MTPLRPEVRRVMMGLVLDGYVVRKIGKGASKRYVIGGKGVRVIFHAHSHTFKGDKKGVGFQALMEALGAPYGQLFSRSDVVSGANGVV